MSTKIKIANFENAIYNRATTAKSAWARGVAKYALDLLDEMKERGIDEIDPRAADLERDCLNGAKDWKQYSEGGCSLICDFEIVDRIATDSEKRKYKAGRLDRPNAAETWLDCQARALSQAFRLIKETATTHARMKDATAAA